MARCEECIHNKVCLHRANIQTDTYAYMGVTYDTEKCKHYSTADVAPKSEVERLEHLRAELSKEVADLQDALKCEKETNAHLCCEYISAKSEVARKIIDEVRRALLNMVLANAIGENFDLEKFFAELEKKYTEEE